jgi:hypothetical protein
MHFGRRFAPAAIVFLTAISALAHPTKSDLKGRWIMKSATCSSGQALESLKGVKGTLVYDGKSLSLGMTDRKGKKQNAFLSDKFVIQEDLLTVPTASGTATMKVQLNGTSSLVLKLPVVGLGGDCPTESELQVLKFERVRI